MKAFNKKVTLAVGDMSDSRGGTVAWTIQ